MARTNQGKFIIVAANTPYLLLRGNKSRAGIKLVNQNAAAIIGYSVGSPRDLADCVQLVPREKEVMDFVTPEEDIWIVSDTANSVAIYLEGV